MIVIRTMPLYSAFQGAPVFVEVCPIRSAGSRTHHLSSFLSSSEHAVYTCVRAFRCLMEGQLVNDGNQNSKPLAISPHERSGSGGSMTAVVGRALDPSDRGDSDLIQTLTDEYASQLS